MRQAVALFRSKYLHADGQGDWTACAKELSRLPGFDGVTRGHLQGWVTADSKLSEQVPNQYGLVVFAQGAKPRLLETLYNELVDSVKQLAATRAFTICSTVLRPIALAFIVERMGEAAIRPGRGNFSCSATWIRKLAHAAELRWRAPYGEPRKAPKDAAAQIHDLRLRMAYLMKEYIIPPCLTLNFDHTGLHFMQIRGNTWATVEEDTDVPHHSRKGKQKEQKQQGKGDKRQATGTVGSSMAGDVLPGQLITPGVMTSSQGLPKLPGNRYEQVASRDGEGMGHSVGFRMVQERGSASDVGQVTRQWLGHMVQTPNHWANIQTSYAILDLLIVPWLLQKKRAIGVPPNHPCILLVDCWYGWKDQDKKKTLESFRSYVRRWYPWLYLLFVPAACTDLVQPADRGMVSWLKAYMRRLYSDTIAAEVTRQLRAGMAISSITLDTRAPTMKLMLATSFARALSALPTEKVLHCWEPLAPAVDQQEQLHREALSQLDRLFPNRATGHLESAVPEGTEPEPEPDVTGHDDFTCCDDDGAELTAREHFLALVDAEPIPAPVPGVPMAAPPQLLAQIVPSPYGQQQ